MNTFFVTGLPRSRTAWMANYLTYGDTFCLHDGFCGLKNPFDMFGKFNEVALRNNVSEVGNCDPANLYFIDALTKQFPKAKWLILNRDIEECRKSCKEAFGQDRDLEFESQQLEKLRTLASSGKLVAMETDYRNLDNVPVMKEIFNFFQFPRKNWSLARHQMLSTMLIQLTEERLARKDLCHPELFNYADKNECILA